MIVPYTDISAIIRQTMLQKFIITMAIILQKLIEEM